MFDTSVDAAARKFGIDSLKKQQVSAIRVSYALCRSRLVLASLLSTSYCLSVQKALVPLRPSDVGFHPFILIVSP